MLASEYNHSQDQIAKVAGKSRSHVANTMRLLKLPDAVKAYINSGKLTAGHARMLIGHANAEVLAEEIVRRDLNVRQVEALTRKSGREQTDNAKRAGRMKDADTGALEQRLTDALGLHVAIEHRDNGSGTLSVRYRTLEQLDEVVRRLESGVKSVERDAGGPRIRRL
jgi:ParB family chromosome partitioning protein